MNLYFLQFSISWAMCAIIWVIQLVHYPTFNYIDKKQFKAFHQHHSNSIGIIVAPLMLLELALSAWFFWQDRHNMLLVLILLCVVALWCCTFFVQVPLHQQLGKRRTQKAIKELIYSNWIRTVLWTVKAVLVTYWMSVKDVLTQM